MTTCREREKKTIQSVVRAVGLQETNDTGFEIGSKKVTDWESDQ